MLLQKNVAEGIHRVEDAYTNWYIVETDGRLTIVDAGMPGSWRSLREALPRIGRRPDDIEALVLTHGHFDHLGFAEQARSHLGIPVHVHENDVPLTRHPRQYGHERPRSWYVLTQLQALPMVASFALHRAWWPRPIAQVSRYRNGQLPVPGAPRVVFTPGHTLGHCSLHFADRDTVIAGDAVVTFNPYLNSKGPQIVSGAATVDSRRALDSLDALAETGARTVLTGHGDPWTAGAEQIADRARRRGPS